MEIREQIIHGKTSLGIELGSTRIKAILIDEDHSPIAFGTHDWENRLEDGVWTYHTEDIWQGIRDCYQDLKKNIQEQYGVDVTTFGSIGISAMMHGYMPFDESGELLVSFRTWRNTMTGEASALLTKELGFHIPQRWSIAHLYQAILRKEEHVKDVRYMTTLAGYIHWKLTGEKVLGVGDASGMFPIDSSTGTYRMDLMEQFQDTIAIQGYPWKLAELLPQVLLAGEAAGSLTEEGARLLDPSGGLQAGIACCPPEGDAGTGMTATNSVAKRTGNVSAGTSVFAMVVLEEALKNVHTQIDMVTTPSGHPVAMVHCNNCTSDLNQWVSVFKEFAESMGMHVKTDQLYETLYRKALTGEKDGGGILAYNYLSGEHITELEEGRPMIVRKPDAAFTLANLMRTLLYSSMATLKIGLDILFQEEHVQVDKMYGHGGLFKTKGVGQKIMAAAIGTPVSVMETAGEGGAWGIAVLASYMLHKGEQERLEDYLKNQVFADQTEIVEEPEAEDQAGFESFMQNYESGLAIERAAVDHLR